MNRTLIPVNLRPHLVSFFYQQFDSYEVELYGKRVNEVKIHTRSVLGRYIRMMVCRIDKPILNFETNFNIIFSINDTERSKIFSTDKYKFVDGTKTFLFIPDYFEKDLNELLQKEFETSLFYFIEGYRANNEYGAMREGARLFMDRYDLYEHGYSYAAIEQIYMRAKRDNKAFVKFCSRPK